MTARSASQRDRLDCEGKPLVKANKSIRVPRALSDSEERTLAAVESWMRLGRSSTATTALSRVGR